MFGLVEAAMPAVSEPWLRWATGPGGPGVHVFYLDGAGNLQQLSCRQGKWSSEVVNAGPHVTMAAPVGRLAFY